MKFITTNLWFDKNAEEAVNFYTSLFPNSKIENTSYYGKEGFEFHQMPEGTVLEIDFEIHGRKFIALNGGPMFKFNESISLYVYCGSEEEINSLYESLIDGGSANMPLNKYDWSERYAWIKDKYGLSWQLDINKINSGQKILPSLLFVNEKFTEVKDAVTHYTNIFPESKLIFSSPHQGDEENLLFAQFSLNGNLLNAMSGAGEHKFDFNEAISLMINCDYQEEVNYFWEKLTEGGSESMCGWLKDKFGISWQVIPTEMFKYIGGSDKESRGRAMNAMFQMKKIDLGKIKDAYEGN